jgi:hypothetical protein
MASLLFSRPVKVPEHLMQDYSVLDQRGNGPSATTLKA